MELKNEFVVPAPPDRVWDFMLDVEKVAPCMPGAEITGTVDEVTWKGKVSIKLGPVSLAFAGTVARQETDEEAHRVVLKAQGTETRGKGAASAAVTSRLEPADEGTRVMVLTDLVISGPVAQYGRGLIADVAERFTADFAQCLAARLSAEGDADGDGAPQSAAKPVSGIRLGLWALFRAFGRTVRRVFGSSRQSG